MVQNTLVIQNQAAQAAREDIQEAIQAVATNNSYVNTGTPPASNPPPQTYPNMWWYDPHTNLLQIRNETDTSWLNGFYINSVYGASIIDDTYVLKTNGQLAGILGDQTTATWETGTGTTESLVSPAKIKAAIDTFASPQSTAAYAVGTYALAGDYGTGLHDVGDTVAGNTLFSWELYSSSDLRSGTTSASAPATTEGQAQTSFTGTWRWMSAGIQAGTRSRLGLAVRIS